MQQEINELKKLLDFNQNENEKLYKQIKQIEQQHKQIEQSMFDENEKLRQELVQTKMLVEQYENSQIRTIKKQSSTIVLTDLISDGDDNLNENQRLKNEINILNNQLTAALAKERKNEDDNILHSLNQKRIKDLERQVKELGILMLMNFRSRK